MYLLCNSPTDKQLKQQPKEKWSQKRLTSIFVGLNPFDKVISVNVSQTLFKQV